MRDVEATRGRRRPCLRHWLLLALLGGARPLAAGEPPAPRPAQDAYEGRVLPFLKKHCTSCHGSGMKKAGLSLEEYPDAASAARRRQVWDLVSRRIRSREMPPPDRPQPSPEEIDGIAAWIGSDLPRLAGAAPGDPGRVTLRRLNRIEYSNTVRDLLGVNYPAREIFPSDDVGYGFDNIGDVLSVSPLLAEKYLAAAEDIARAALQEGTESRKRLIPRDPEPGKEGERAWEILADLASRAFRRPPAVDEVDRLFALYESGRKDGGRFDAGIRLALEAVLSSPHFIYRVEIDPEPEDRQAVHPVSEWELAARLSYFLWSSMPDRELFAKAREGSLRRDLEAQARRLLGDPRSRALVENFGGQWLQIRSLAAASPDPGRFPSFDEELRRAMLQETEMFFAAVLAEDRSVLEFLESDFTFLNERLARHYGIPGVQGKEMRKVPLKDGLRGGVLTQASVLTATSNPTRTSPVKRGKWVLEVLLGAPPPPPPPNVPELPDRPGDPNAGTLRQRMERHRADPACATCHQRMDPLGFGLENFDAVGAFRERDGGHAIDPSGKLPDGRTFRGPGELKGILRQEAEAFRMNLSEKMLTYALGRGIEAADRPAVEKIAGELRRGGDRFSALILAIVRSDPFQMRRGEGGKP